MAGNSSHDFIEESLREVRDRRAILGTIRRVQWTLFGTIALGIALVAILFRIGNDQRETLIKIKYLELNAGKPIFVRVEHWESPPFKSGSSECIAAGEDGKPAADDQKPDGKSGLDPCHCLYLRSASIGSSCTSIADIAASVNGAAFFFAIGGHDKSRLSKELSQSVKSNEELAKRRAEAVSNVLERSRMRLGESALKRAAGLAPSDVTARGPLELRTPSGGDRTVRVMIVHLTEQPWQL